MAQVIPTHSSCSSSFMPVMASWLSSLFIPGVASLLSSFLLPGVVCGMHGRVPSYTAVFRPVRYGLWYVWWSSVLPGVPCVAVFRSARHGMHGVVPFRPGWHARWSSVPPGMAYAEVFRSVWRGLVCTAVFCSLWHGPVCTAVFRSARRGIGVPFCLARPGVRGGPPFCPAWHTWRSSVLLGAECAVFFHSARDGMRGGLPFRRVRHTRRCSVLSGAARYARRCCGSILGGPGSLVALPDDPVIIGASDPRCRCCSRHAAQRCVKVGQGR